MSKNIKEIGKELLGKSLNSFHRKTGLIQLEKNNEMQDGILDGILSQVDDAYIEKTEQSSVLHLDGSGDGVVVLDSIEGNTMVNLIITNMMNFENNSVNAKNITTVDLKPSTTYTFVAHLKDVSSTNTWLARFHFNNITDGKEFYINVAPHQTYTSNSIMKYSFTTPDSNYKYRRTWVLWNAQLPEGEKMSFHNAMLIEGDLTNKEVNLFNGLQSSFEEKVNDEGKYEIEILMNNKNLLDSGKYIISQTNGSIGAISNNILTLGHVASSGMYCEYQSEFIKVKEETAYSFSSYITEKNGANANHIMRYYDSNKNQIGYSDGINNGVGSYTRRFTIVKGTKYIKFCIGSHTPALDDTLKSCKVDLSRVMLKIGDIDTNVVSYKSNKIKLLINEPLRSTTLDKDRLCIVDGKLMIERKNKQIIINGEERYKQSNLGEVVNCAYFEILDMVDAKKRTQNGEVYCDRLPSLGEVNKYQDKENIFCDPNYNLIGIKISRSKLTTHDIDGIKTYFRNNNTKLCYPLKEPYYEEVVNEYGEPIILEGYENGTIYIDSTIVPTTTVRYTPKMESFKTLNEVNNNNIMLTNDIDDNIIPYMMDVDLMIMEKEMALMSHKNIRTIGVKDMTSMQKRTQDMLTRLIKGKTLTEQECKTRVVTYLNAGKITDAQAEELNFLIDEIYA